MPPGAAAAYSAWGMIMLLGTVVLPTALASGILAFLGIGIYLWVWESFSRSALSEEGGKNRSLRLLAALIRLAIWVFKASIAIQTVVLGLRLLGGVGGVEL